MDIAVAGSSGLGPVIGVGAQPAALLTALPAAPSEHALVLTPRHLERRAREQAHVVVAAHGDARVGVLAFDHHALALTLIASAVLELQGAPRDWSEPGAGMQLVRQAAARSRSVVRHPGCWASAGRCLRWVSRPPVSSGGPATSPSSARTRD